MYSSKIITNLLNTSMNGSSKHFFECVLTIFAILLCTTCLLGKNGFWTRLKRLKRQIKLINRFPGLGNYPLLGSYPEMYVLAMSPCEALLPWAKDMWKRHGPVVKFWVPGQPKLIISCADTATFLLQHENCRGKPSEAAVIARASNGEGLLALPPETHAPRRKQWMQWMSRRNINGTFSTFREQAVSLCKMLEQFEMSGNEFNIMEPVVHSTFKTIATSAFGEEFMENLPDSVGKQYIRDLHTFSFNFTKRSFRPWLHNDWIYFNLSADGRNTFQCIKRGNELTARALAERKLLRESTAEETRKGAKVPCFLDHFLDLVEQGHMSESQVIKELNVMIVAGHDTSGLAICYVLYCLAMHPEHQTKVVEELVSIFGENLDKFGEITPDHLREMRYLELCIKESLRLYPIAPFSFRATTDDVVLPDGKVIPEGVDLYLAIYQIHRDPNYFPEPGKFIPSRHSQPISAFIPFALGSRNCVGQVYAMHEMKMILAHLFMKYRWETTETEELKLLMTTFLIPANGIHFKIQKRFEN